MRLLAVLLAAALCSAAAASKDKKSYDSDFLFEEDDWVRFYTSMGWARTDPWVRETEYRRRNLGEGPHNIYLQQINKKYLVSGG